MIDIVFPMSHRSEREYIVDVVFSEFLELEYNSSIGEGTHYVMTLPNGKQLLIEDHFFSQFSDGLEYLQERNIPKEICYVENRFIPEANIPIIYGRNKLEIGENDIICGIDIFSSIFFMLSRWEEYVNKTRDYHNRFPATASLAYRQGFLNRPVVNEFIELLWNLMAHLGYDKPRKKCKSELYLTHDVDEIKMWNGIGRILRVAGGDVCKRFNPIQALKNIFEYVSVNIGVINDPFDTFDWLMDKSESIGIKSRFYFMSGGTSKIYDNRYSLKDSTVLKTLNNILSRGHIIGLHSSYNSYIDPELFYIEKSHMENTWKISVTEGRQHYLRFEVPTTWKILNDSGMLLDTSCGYADSEGFRCGTGDIFSVYDILQRKKLRLKERPLVFMDKRDYDCGGHVQDNNFNNELMTLLERSKKSNSVITLLYHNSVFIKDKRFYQEYEKVIECVG